MIDWSKYPSFSEQEMACQATGDTGVKEILMDNLQELRNRVGVLYVSSGYRSPEHPIEAAKMKAGTHTTGYAVDVLCSGGRAYEVLNAAINQGVWSGIGINQNGSFQSRFIHLDCVPEEGLSGYEHISRPTLWSY